MRKFKVIDKSGEEILENFFICFDGRLFLFCDMTGEYIDVSDKFEYFWLG